jgi:hypothetical protein
VKSGVSTRPPTRRTLKNSERKQGPCRDCGQIVPLCLDGSAMAHKCEGIVQCAKCPRTMKRRDAGFVRGMVMCMNCAVKA